MDDRKTQEPMGQGAEAAVTGWGSFESHKSYTGLWRIKHSVLEAVSLYS
jgi:hypothetical protein